MASSPPARPPAKPTKGSSSSSGSNSSSSPFGSLLLPSSNSTTSQLPQQLLRRASDAGRRKVENLKNLKNSRRRSDVNGFSRMQGQVSSPPPPTSIRNFADGAVLPPLHSAADMAPGDKSKTEHDAELDAELVARPDVVSALHLLPPRTSRPPMRTPEETELDDEVFVPEILREGVVMLKVSAKKAEQRKVRLAPEQGQLLWESKKSGLMNLESIRELRFGKDARGFRTQFKISAEHEPRWISIIFTTAAKYNALHLVALTDDHFDLWKNTLCVLHEQRRQLMGGLDQTLDQMRKRQSMWLRQYWTQADRSYDQVVDFEEVVKLCGTLNIATTEEVLRKNFDAADAKNRGYLDFTDFQKFVKLLKRRPELEALFSYWSEGKDVMSPAKFADFLKSEQKSKAEPTTVEAIYKKFSDQQQEGLTVEGFTSFLLSSDNAAFAERETRVWNDMTRPINEYFVSSSHNTYLVGGQLHGESTSEGYVRALQQGCRCVELDVHEGQDEPVVTHGRTLTSKITVREALLAISKYAFVASPYPVILSMEVHLELPQQDILASILKEILGDALVKDRLDQDPNTQISTLPSPEALKFKFLLKAKNMFVVKDMQAASEAESESETSESSSTNSDSEFKRAITRPLRALGVGVDKPRSPPATASSTNTVFSPPRPSASSSRNPSTTTAVTINSAPPSQTTFPRRRSVQTNKSSSSSSKAPAMSFQLAALIVYTVGIKMRGFNKKEQYQPEHVISLGEKRAFKMLKEATNDLISHNRSHLLRTYPAGTRFTSSNYLPHHLWAVGVQLAAINWQTFDLGAEVNTAMFLRNGRCGYVLKPEVLRSKGSLKDKELLANPKQYNLKVSIISAQQLPRRRNKDHEEEDGAINSYVEVEILAPNSSSRSEKTKTAWKNGFAPVWNESFEIPFEVIGGMIELVFLRLTVWENAIGGDDRTLAKYCISVADLQPGYRHLPLYDNLGQQHLFSSVFIKSSLASA